MVYLYNHTNYKLVDVVDVSCGNQRTQFEGETGVEKRPKLSTIRNDFSTLNIRESGGFVGFQQNAYIFDGFAEL
jgi:hypothetical protein